MSFVCIEVSYCCSAAVERKPVAAFRTGSGDLPKLSFLKRSQCFSVFIHLGLPSACDGFTGIHLSVCLKVYREETPNYLY